MEVKNLYLGVDYLVPTEDRILIKRLKKEVGSVTGSGLIISSGRVMNDKGEFDEAVEGTEKEENTYYADVLEVGPEVKGIKAGHKIMITKYAGVELVSGSNVFMIKEADAIAIVA